MGLQASLYSGITGLSAHGDKMAVIGNNLANINTTAYKGSNMYFEDVMSQDIYTSAGVGQVGRGVRVAAVYADYSQGSLESTTEATDLAISGDGFFVVSPKGEEANYYTRAGDFRFDNDGYLVDSHGYVVQGWAVDSTSSSSSARIIGTPTDIRLENFQSPPSATTEVTMITNLDPSTESLSNSSTNPYFALFENWDGQDDTPLADTAYGYSATIKVYDEIGTAHNMTIYYDQVTMSDAGGDTVWEFMVTCSPTEDGRTLTHSNTSTRMSETSAAGILMIGTLTFRTGALVGMSAFTLGSNGAATGGVKDLQNWTPAEFSTSGYPVVTANFLGRSNANLPGEANAKPIEINFGIRNTNLASNASGPAGWNVQNGSFPANAAAIGNKIDSSGWLPNFKSPEIDALATQSYDTGGSSTLFEDQDGYAAGFLQNVSVSRDGVLTGTYSNGQVLDLYSLTLATFTNEWGLRRNGGNLFTETQESGAALTSTANTAGKGTVASNSLESSNVDMSAEFVDMITTQRGFQANTKVITTVDSMLSDVISMKR